MQNSLSPAFVRINSTSAYGAHSTTIPSVPLIAPPGGVGGYGFDLRGAAIDVNAQDSIEDFVNLLKVFYPSTYTFIDYVLFSQPAPEDVPVPVESNVLSIAGTNIGGGWAKAVQETWTWRTTEFGIFKLVMLDAVSDNSFDKLTNISGSAPHEALSDYVTADVTWIAGRDGGRPNTFLQIAKTLNEKLRRSYRMN